MRDRDLVREVLGQIGEAAAKIETRFKAIDKVADGELLTQYPEVDWKKAKGMRDILTHHYADISAEAVFNTCQDKIPHLHATIRKMIGQLG